MFHSRRGFTLVEVIVALTISVIVLLGARAILNQLADTADRISAETIESDRVANSERLVRALFDRTVAADEHAPFVGTASALSFGSWCDVPAGWLERCTVSLLIAPDSMSVSSGDTISHAVVNDTLHTVSVFVRTSAGDLFRFGDRHQESAFRYLDDAANGGHWVTRWTDSTHTPLAVGIVTRRDTTVLRIGPRR